jgi:ATP-dependent helicase HrpB
MAALPIEEVLPELRAQLASRRAVVLQAPPGAGKTTMVPLALLDAPWLAGRSIVILEPRRLAARAAAMRMSQLRGEGVGETVGYRIRFESKVSARTRIEVLTEGILTRRLQGDPELKGVGLVIFDEFHERHLHADLALALCLDCQRGLREDLKILVMSATLDGAAISRLLENAPIVASTGRSYPVDIRYQPRDPQGSLPPIVAEAVVRALGESDGDALAFLPGAWEIRRTQELLQERLGDAVDILPLYGDLPWEAQDRAIRPGSTRRKIVLATPIAETSLTIEGVRVVVDAGFARVPQFDPGSGLSRLTTVRVSRASADQRAGRAGRTAPGVCYRLWGESTQRGLVPQSAPEIRTADLAPLTLELSAWGVSDVNSLSWLDPPPAPALAQARKLLTELDALDAEGRLTDAGQAMVALPLHPRLAHMLYYARTLGMGDLACDVAALLSERDVLASNARRSVDFGARLDALRAFRDRGRAGVQALGADVNACQRVSQAADQYRRLLRLAADRHDPSIDRVGLLLALAYPDRVALARDKSSGRYLLASGRGARLREDEMRLRAPCIVAASLDAREEEGLIYLAAPLDEADLRRHFAGHIRVEDRVRWDSPKQVVVAQREELFGALILESKPLPKAAPERVRDAMLEGIRRLGIEALPWSPELRQWQARVLCLREWCPEEGLPDVSDGALLESLEQWLAPFLDGITRRDHLSRIDLGAALNALLEWKQARRLDEGAPTHIEVPSGSRLRLEYAPGQSPVLAVKLQEMFGSADTPRVAWGRVPVTLHLLSPARRPIQVTQDLRGFWDRTYSEVKKELKGRYPKHPWPDDPWNAPPTRRTQRAGK